MSYIINPYRYGAGDDPPGGDYVTITVDSSLTIEEDMFDSDYKYFVVDGTLTSAFTVTDAGDSGGSDTIEVYLIAGGGGGGAAGTIVGVGAGAGGGAGGYLRDLSYDNGGSLAQTYNVTIAGGAAGGTAGGGDPNDATSGDDSQLYDTVSRSMNFADGDYLTTDSSTDFAWGTGDYTMEFWVKPDDLDAWEVLFYSSEFVLYLSAGKLRLYYNGYSSGWYIGTVACVVANEWNNVAIARESGTTRFFVNGEEQAIDNGSETDSYDWGSSAISLQIGSYSTFDYAGLFTGIRLTKGEALYTADYTPISAPYSAGSNTKLLIQPNTDQSDFTDSSGEGHTLTATGISWPTDLSTDLPTMIGIGGGKGGAYDTGLTSTSVNPAWGADGGSGGGGGYYSNPSYSPPIGLAGSGTAGQGNDGGVTPNTSTYVHGGGGGAGSVGADGGSGSGNGGDGVQYEWMDDSYNMLGPDGDGYFAVGGGGGRNSGNAGSGGGGDGNSGDGAANSGGGGGGGNSGGGDGGSGGSGYLIIRWKYQN